MRNEQLVAADCEVTWFKQGRDLNEDDESVIDERIQAGKRRRR